VKLGVDTYFLKEAKDSKILEISTIVDFFFNFCFIIEMFFKVIAMGLIMDEGSYLRDSWN